MDEAACGNKLVIGNVELREVDAKVVLLSIKPLKSEDSEISPKFSYSFSISESPAFDERPCLTPLGWSNAYNEDQFLNKIDNVESLYVQQIDKRQSRRGSSLCPNQDEANSIFEPRPAGYYSEIEPVTPHNAKITNVVGEVDMAYENAAADGNPFSWLDFQAVWYWHPFEMKTINSMVFINSIIFASSKREQEFRISWYDKEH